MPGRRPIVIAHRGASGHRPEHTLASYELAIDLGADFIEPDLVSTKDGILVARHENEIGGTTDVAAHPEFAARKATKTIDGRSVSGWFTEDFTLAELKRLRARERLPRIRPANTAYDGLYEIPTFEEVVDLVTARAAALGRRIGIYPETKHAGYFESIRLALEERLVRIVDGSTVGRSDVPVFIQSFEAGSLRRLRSLTERPLVQLISIRTPELARPESLAEITRYAAGVGLDKDLIRPRDSAGELLGPTTVVADAHEAGLVVHAWTFRAENTFLPTNLRKGDPANPTFLTQLGDWRAEYEAFFGDGIDGVFADQPDLARAARDRSPS